MFETQPSNAELVRLLEPWFPLFARVGTAAERDFLRAIPLLGPPRKTERANDLHRAWRTNLRRVCDLTEPIFLLREEPEGQGLDYLLCKMRPDLPFVLRWGRFNGETIRRNRTERSTQIQEQGRLFATMEPDAEELPAVTLAHTIEDEYTEAGQPCLWIGRLLLVRERRDESEVITEVHVYEKPDRQSRQADELPAPLVSARRRETKDWEKIVKHIQRGA